MRFVDVKRIALYYKAIPGMLHLLRQERAELEEEYNGLGSTAADGTPHGSSPGKPTEELGLRALENGIRIYVHVSDLESIGVDTPADLDGLRCRLDETDAAILELFDRRQRLSAAIGAYKSAHGLPVRDKAREAEVLRTRGDMLPERRDQAERLMTLLMALSREEQA